VASYANPIVVGHSWTSRRGFTIKFGVPMLGTTSANRQEVYPMDTTDTINNHNFGQLPKNQLHDLHGSDARESMEQSSIKNGMAIETIENNWLVVSTPLKNISQMG